MISKHVYALIMAGGEGTRFAPLSTPEKPKQFLHLIGDKTFLQHTRTRVASLVPPERIYVATNERYRQLVREQLPEISPPNIIAEPFKKNTAPCIAYAAHLIFQRDPKAIMLVLPSDHVIYKEREFLEIVKMAISVAEKQRTLTTIGLKPSWPSSEYGYIRAADPISQESRAFCVAAFVEKPDAVTAREYIATGNYYWNSGMFVWTVSDILSEIDQYMPALSRALQRFENTDAYLQDYFMNARAISIDKAVMEKSRRVAVIPCDIGWSDVGTWEGLYRLYCDHAVQVTPEALAAMHKVIGHVGPNECAVPRRVEKPWGHEEIWAHTEQYVGKILCINKHHRLSYQFHKIKEETIRVLEGVLELEYASDDVPHTVKLHAGDSFHIAPLTKHRMHALEQCRILEVSTPYLGDVVRLQDDYGRTEKDMP